MSDARDPFDERLRTWADQPPRLGAAEAAREVCARLGSRRPEPWRPLAWAAAVLALAAGLWLALSPGPRAVPAAGPPAPLPENVVQFWLDAETPVYFLIGPPRPSGGAP